jgi:hypothetical protein
MNTKCLILFYDLLLSNLDENHRIRSSYFSAYLKKSTRQSSTLLPRPVHHTICRSLFNLAVLLFINKYMIDPIPRIETLLLLFNNF